MMTPPPVPLAASATSMGDANARADLARPRADGAEAAQARVPAAVVRRFEQALSGRSRAQEGEADEGVSTELLADWLAQAWGLGSGTQMDLPFPSAQAVATGVTRPAPGSAGGSPPANGAATAAAALALPGETGAGGAAGPATSQALLPAGEASAQVKASQPAAWQTGAHADPPPGQPLVQLSQPPTPGSAQAPRGPSGRAGADASSPSHGPASARAPAGAPEAASALASHAARARADGLVPGASPASDSAPGDDADAGNALAAPALAASPQGPGAWLPPVSSDTAAPRAAEAQVQAVWQQVHDMALRMAAGTGRAGVHQVRLDIDPRVLPGVQVTLQMMAGQVQVEFLCAADATRRRLRAVAQRELGGMAQRLGRSVEVTLRASGVEGGGNATEGWDGDGEHLHAGV